MKDDTTPLHVAAQNGRPDDTRVLLERGANVRAERVHGRTASQRASERGYDHIMTLLEYGARRKHVVASRSGPTSNLCLRWATSRTVIFCHAPCDSIIRD